MVPLLLVAGLLAALASGFGPRPAPEDVRPSTEEWFEVRGAAPDAPAGWARLVRGPEAGGSFRVELELELFGPEVVLHQVERIGPDEQELVYRERRAGGGRTLRVRWTGPARDAVAERVEWCGRERLASWRNGARPATPLLLAEAARWTDPPDAAVACYAPSADAEESRRGVLARAGHAMPLGLAPLAGTLPRLVTWRDEHGDVRAWRRFSGGELIAFGFAPGGPVAVRCGAERAAELRALSPRAAAPSPAVAAPSPEALGRAATGGL